MRQPFPFGPWDAIPSSLHSEVELPTLAAPAGLPSILKEESEFSPGCQGSDVLTVIQNRDNPGCGSSLTSFGRMARRMVSHICSTCTDDGVFV